MHGSNKAWLDLREGQSSKPGPELGVRGLWVSAQVQMMERGDRILLPAMCQVGKRIIYSSIRCVCIICLCQVLNQPPGAHLCTCPFSGTTCSGGGWGDTHINEQRHKSRGVGGEAQTR